jgi:cytochrome c oxidase cbb3-type subunit 3/ubiquinol-cytochrome c reductase cytochrome c subunit
MKTGVGFWLLVALVTFECCGRPIEPPQRSASTEFEGLYAANCAGCHGVDGNDGVAQPLNDPVYLALIGEGRLREVISRGVSGTPMPAFGRSAGGMLTAAQVDRLAKEMLRRWGGSEAPISGDLPAYSADEASRRGTATGDHDRGQATFGRYCERCHGPEGEGGSAGSIVDRSFLNLTSDQGIRTTVIAGRTDKGAHGWRDYSPNRPMTDQEISDVVSWLTSLRGTR